MADGTSPISLLQSSSGRFEVIIVERTRLVPPHDHLEEVLARPLRQLLDAQVVDYKKIRLEVFVQNLVRSGEGFVGHEVPHDV